MRVTERYSGMAPPWGESVAEERVWGPHLSAVIFSAALQLYKRARRPVNHSKAQVHVLHRLLLCQSPFLENRTAGQGQAMQQLQSQ